MAQDREVLGWRWPGELMNLELGEPGQLRAVQGRGRAGPCPGPLCSRRLCLPALDCLWQ